MVRQRIEMLFRSIGVSVCIYRFGKKLEEVRGICNQQPRARVLETAKGN